MPDQQRFEGDVITKWLMHPGQDRKMELQQEFAFIDSKDVTWPAQTGDVVDGASIPEVLWNRVVGTPFVGDYRRATVVHDVAVSKQLYSSRQAARMFYEAMLEDGTPRARAWMMYMAVRLFGPRWPTETGEVNLMAADAGTDPDALAEQFDFDHLEAAIDQLLGEQ